jgi:hypothetical protein
MFIINKQRVLLNKPLFWRRRWSPRRRGSRAAAGAPIIIMTTRARAS